MNSNRRKVFSADLHDRTVEVLFGEVFFVVPHDATVEGLLKEIFSTRSMLRWYKQGNCWSSLSMKRRVELYLRVG
jgi:hypothetical protein